MSVCTVLENVASGHCAKSLLSLLTFSETRARSHTQKKVFSTQGFATLVWHHVIGGSKEVAGIRSYCLKSLPHAYDLTACGSSKTAYICLCECDAFGSLYSTYCFSPQGSQKA